jgi:divalent metal cation (Fe/Co/Zn/Cd) transporter
MTMAAAHDICDPIEGGLREAAPGSRASIHVEPENEAKRAGIVMGSA